MGISFDFIILLPTSLCQEELLGEAGQAEPDLHPGSGKEHGQGTVLKLSSQGQGCRFVGKNSKQEFSGFHST